MNEFHESNNVPKEYMRHQIPPSLSHGWEQLERQREKMRRTYDEKDYPRPLRLGRD